MKVLEEDIFTYLEEKRNDMKNKYNRVLPTGELFFDRYKKAEFLGFGQGSSVYDTSIIIGDIKVGQNVWIGPYTILEGINDKLTIGDFVSINSGVMIYTHDSTKYYISGGKEPFKKGSVSIGNNSVIGSMSIINCGVSIGQHCVVSAQSMVVKNVEDYQIVGGVPAKVIGEVFIDEDEVKFRFFKK